MAVKNTPIAISTRKDHDAADFRQAVVAGFAGGADMKPVAGVVPGWGDELAVSVGTGLQVVVGSGLALIPAPDPAEGGWIIPNDGDLDINLAAAHPSNDRIDLIIIRVSDAQYHPGADNLADIEVITGTAASTPVAPTVPSGKGEYIELRRVAVGNGATSLTVDDVTLPPDGVPYTRTGGAAQFWAGSDSAGNALSPGNNGTGPTTWTVTTPAGSALLTVHVNLSSSISGTWQLAAGVSVDGIDYLVSVNVATIDAGGYVSGSIVIPVTSGVHTLRPRYVTGTGPGGTLTFQSSRFTLLMGESL